MKPLASTFTSKKFLFTQVKRVGDVAIFERKRPEWKHPGYEVVRVRKYPEYVIAGVKVEAHEALPPDEAFGKEGWAVANLARAEEIFDKLVKENPYSTITGVAKGTAPGRQRSEFEIEVPAAGEFTVKDMQDKYPGRSGPFIHIRLNELIEQGKVEKLAPRKVEGQRGKPMCVFRAVPTDHVPQEIK